MQSITRRALLACAAAAACLSAAPALAETAWPDKPVRLVVPYTPGGATDIVARLIAQKVMDDTKWTFIVDNRAGGNGNIGMDVVAKAKPDGYTIGLGQTANLAINPTLFPKMPYDALKDLMPVSVVASQPVVLVVRADAPFKTLAELVAAAKAKPGEIRQALAGTGTLGHMAGEVLARRAGFKVLNVPYKGAAPAITDLLGGQTDYMFATPQGALSMVKGGRLRALAVTSAKRLPVTPDVPTVAESGVPGYEAYVWMGLMAPRGTPPAIVDLINRELRQTLATDEVRNYMTGVGIEIVVSSPDEFGAFFRAERDRWAKVIRETGAKTE